jgi:hypothetical protein
MQAYFLYGTSGVNVIPSSHLTERKDVDFLCTVPDILFIKLVEKDSVAVRVV